MEDPSMCTVCEAQGVRPWLKVDEYQICRCQSCTHGFVANMPTESDLRDLYSSDASDDDFLGNVFADTAADMLDATDAAGTSYYADRLRLIRRLAVPSDATLLDFGCAMGGFLQTLAKVGEHRSTGFDLSASLVQKGRDRWGLDLHSGDSHAFLSSRKSAFDVVCCFFVLEHVPDPRATLAMLIEAVKPGGFLVLAVPNAGSIQVLLSGAKSPIVDPPHHLQYFTPESLTRMLEREGLDVQTQDTVFWSGESDLYLHEKGMPLRLARWIRMGMAVPGIPINFLGLGGVVNAVARRR